MIGHTLRRAAAYAAVLGLVSVAWLPPTHVHRGAPEDDQHEAEVTHRHLGWHQALPSPSNVDHPEAEDAQYIRDVFTVARSAHSIDTGRELAVAVDGFGISPTLAAHPPLSGHTLRTHDPPWRSSPALRGPPVFLA